MGFAHVCSVCGKIVSDDLRGCGSSNCPSGTGAPILSPPSLEDIEARKWLDARRKEMKATETPEMIYELGENARQTEEDTMESNGTGGAGAPQEQEAAPSAKEVMTPDAVVQKLNAPFQAVVGTMLRGLVFGTAGVPPQAVLNIVCWTVGYVAASMIQSDIATLIKIRNGFADAFGTGMKAAKMVTPPMQPQDAGSPLPDFSKLRG